ncbi:MAG: ankyrin repeat domain-containing protein [Candidatus Eremiobacteraeota bacterium]|nr:ankyrin repeat domain-containing protein [Candidatus Eremiobacteraeota bacterium]
MSDKDKKSMWNFIIIILVIISIFFFVLLLLKYSDSKEKYNNIHEAVKARDMQAVKGLIKKKHELVNSRDEHFYTPLHWAVFSGKKDMAKFLLDSGADINAKDMNGVTPLNIATSASEKEMVEFLHRHGAKE